MLPSSSNLVILPLVAALASCGSNPEPVVQQDLAFKQLAWPADSSQLKQSFAARDSTRTPSHPNESGVRPTVWNYAWGSVELDESGTVYIITIEDPSIATSRGVRVGDAREKVVARYGEPTYQEGDYSTYALGGQGDWGELGITFIFTGAKLEAIVIGHVISVG